MKTDTKIYEIIKELKKIEHYNEHFGLRDTINKLHTMKNAYSLDLAEAQLTGFAHARDNQSGVVSLVEDMVLTKEEWIELKLADRTRLDKYDFEVIEDYFNEEN